MGDCYVTPSGCWRWCIRGCTYRRTISSALKTSSREAPPFHQLLISSFLSPFLFVSLSLGVCSTIVGETLFSTPWFVCIYIHTHIYIYILHVVHRSRRVVPIINYLQLGGRLKPILRSAFFSSSVNYAIGGRRWGQTGTKGTWMDTDGRSRGKEFVEESGA